MSQPDLMGTSCKVDTDCLGPDAGHDAFQTCFNGQCIITCVNICISTENNGVSLNPACVATATSCESANDCGVATTSGVSCTGPNCKVSPTSK
jgi:hypothetical protein